MASLGECVQVRRHQHSSIKHSALHIHFPNRSLQVITKCNCKATPFNFCFILCTTTNNNPGMHKVVHFCCISLHSWCMCKYSSGVFLLRGGAPKSTQHTREQWGCSLCMIICEVNLCVEDLKLVSVLFFATTISHPYMNLLIKIRKCYM